MSTPQQVLLAEVLAHIAERGMAETTFGRYAVNDGKFVGRLRAGANMTIATIDRARGYINAAKPIGDSASGADEGQPDIHAQTGEAA